jgi:toxin FitB
MIRVVLDTDAVSLYRKGQLPDALARHIVPGAFCVSFVTAGELHKWAIMRRWGTVARDAMELWLDETIVLPYSLAVARNWGVLAAAAQRRGRRRPDNDTWIAACCLHDHLPLLTRNGRDFLDFAEHHGLVLLAA